MSTLTVFGSANMDLVAYVATAPMRGETVLGRDFRTVPGGKGANQAIAAARAGATVRMIGAVGSDELGTLIRDNLDSSRVDTKGLRTVSGRSGTAHIVVDDAGANSIVVVPAANASVNGLEPGDAERIATSRLLLLQLETPFEGVLAAAQVAREHGVLVVLTPAPATEIPDPILCQVDLIVPNEQEATVLTGQEDPSRALSHLVQRVPAAVITLGARGSLYGDSSGARIETPGHQVQVVDTTAAGDTFVGVLSTLLTEDATQSEALRWAAAAAALSVRRNGASSSMPTRKEIAEFLPG